MHRLASGPSRNAVARGLNVLEDIFLRCDEINPRRGNAVDPRIAEVINYLCQSLEKPLSIAHLADIAGLSISRFAHLFRDEMGVTPVQYVEQRKMEQARQTASHDIDAGGKRSPHRWDMDSAFYFSRRFTMNNQCSPTDYRNRGLT